MPPDPTNPTYIACIGGSAGGLKAYKALLEVLPANTNMAFVVIAHMDPNGKSILPQLLSFSASMPVTVAKEGIPLAPNHVYVIAPNTDLTIDGRLFKIVSPRTMRSGKHKQVDVFLESLAETMKSQAIGIIMSGGDGDGTVGCKHIKANGGITFAQDLSADVDSMPLSAQTAGCIDFVLSPAKIAAELIKIAERRTTLHG